MSQLPVISGIQQIGIGNPYVHEAWKWYRIHLGMDIRIFEEAAEANLMLPYTGGQPHKRHAVLAINLNGGVDLRSGNTPAENRWLQIFPFSSVIWVYMAVRSKAAMYRPLTTR